MRCYITRRTKVPRSKQRAPPQSRSAIFDFSGYALFFFGGSPINEVSHLLGSTSIDVEHEFSVFSDGTPPLFYQGPHIVDQSSQVILVDDYPLLFQAILETGGIEAFVCLHVVQNLVAIFEPDCLVFSVFVFLAGRAHPGGKVVEQCNQLFRFQRSRRSAYSKFPSLAENFGSWSSLLFLSFVFR
jgi:hypothetical protein